MLKEDCYVSLIHYELQLGLLMKLRAPSKQLISGISRNGW